MYQSWKFQYRNKTVQPVQKLWYLTRSNVSSIYPAIQLLQQKYQKRPGLANEWSQGHSQKGVRCKARYAWTGSSMVWKKRTIVLSAAGYQAQSHGAIWAAWQMYSFTVVIAVLWNDRAEGDGLMSLWVCTIQLGKQWGTWLYPINVGDTGNIICKEKEPLVTW